MTATTAPAGMSGREYVRLLGLAAAIGIPAALLAALFLALVHELEGWLWDACPTPSTTRRRRGSS